jgi:hypothetical protein
MHLRRKTADFYTSSNADGTELILVDFDQDFSVSETGIKGIDIVDDVVLVKCPGEDHWRHYTASSLGNQFFLEHPWKRTTLFNAQMALDLLSQDKIWSSHNKTFGIGPSCNGDMQIPPDYNPRQSLKILYPADQRCNYRMSNGNVSSLSDAAMIAIGANSNAKIFSFGEKHDVSPNVKLTMFTFIREIMPILIDRAHVEDFVFEIFSPDIPPSEYNEYFKAGGFTENTKKLKAFVEGWPKGGQELLHQLLGEFAKLYKTGYRFNIHGSGLTADENLKLPDAVAVITQRTAAAATTLIKSGKRPVLYNGANHTLFDERPANMDVWSGFLKENPDVTMNDIVRIGLFTPEAFCNVGMVVPRSGAYLEPSQDLKHFIIVLPLRYDPVN